MLFPTASEIEIKFGREPDRSAFPRYCNSLIALEAPRSSTFPVLSNKPGPDGGIDGEWDFEGTAGTTSSVVALSGWNVYQFKTADVASLGMPKALAELRRRVEGAVMEVITRLATPKIPARYVLFTNLQLGLGTQSTTTGHARLNTQRGSLAEALLKDAPPGVDVQIIDAAQIEAFTRKHPALAFGWFSSSAGIPWDEMYRREKAISEIQVPLVGREVELALLRDSLALPEVRVIVMTGTNSVGKTRLALEATHNTAPSTIFATDAEELLNVGLNVFATSERPLLIVADDPPSDAIESLAKQSLSATRPIKLLITLPSPANAPVISIASDERLCALHIEPLPHDAAKALVQTVNNALDNRAIDWIVQQAGGIPGVLVDAARADLDLRRESETLRDKLTLKYRQRLERRCGLGAMRIARVLCPLINVRIHASASELQILLSELAGDLSASFVLNELITMEELGYVRRRGEYVTLVPPLFAAGLFKQLIVSLPDLPERLFAVLDLSGIKRLIERLVTLEMPESSRFWVFIFGPDGPFGDPQRFIDHFDLLDCLARAAPSATARFLERRFEFIWDEVLPLPNQGTVRMRSALLELLDDQESASIAFALITSLVCREICSTEHSEFENTFVECFAFWYPWSIPYQEREGSVERLLMQPEPLLQDLALRAVVMATNPPPTLSGRGVARRRLGPTPEYGTLRERYDYLLRMMRRRIKLCIHPNLRWSDLAKKNLAASLGEFSRSVPVGDAMTILHEITDLHFTGKLALDLKDLYASIRWLRGFYLRSRENMGQEGFSEKWNEVILEIDALLLRLRSGSFIDRLRIAVGHTYEFDKVTFEDREVYEYQVPLLRLASEASNQPDLVDEEVWKVIDGKRMQECREFVSFLGEKDRERHHFAALKSRGADWQNAAYLSDYLSGANLSSPEWVEITLDEMMNKPGLKAFLAIRAVGPTPKNRLRLRTLLSHRSISPKDVAMAFSSGRWLDTLPPDEVRTVLEFIVSEPGLEGAMLEVVSLYVHKDKPISRELFSVARLGLTAICDHHGNRSYCCDQAAAAIARTDLDVGFALLEEMIERLSLSNEWQWNACWNPFETTGTHDFWEYLRKEAPERAYRSAARWRRTSRWPELRDRSGSSFLDLEAHCSILMNISRADENAARVFADMTIPTQARFFSFAYALIELYPGSPAVSQAFSDAIIEPVGFGSDFERLALASKMVKQELDSGNPPAAARRWLKALSTYIDQRRSESKNHWKPPEPGLWD